jgi:uncharacterized protein (TIGR00297 family)
MVVGFRPVRPGISGAVSLEGTLAGLAAAFALSGLAVVLGLIAPRYLWFAAAGATAGAFVESALGGTLEGPGILNNDLLNFMNTVVAAAAALVLVSIFSS